MKWEVIAKVIEWESRTVAQAQEVRHISADSRLINQPDGALFFAISGQRHNGHDFVEPLYALGVRNFVVEEDLDPTLVPEANFIKVADSVTALQQLARFHRKQFDIPVIGITGSNGKTIIKEWLAGVLSRRWRITKSPKSYNSQIGVPLSVWLLNDKTELGIFEAGISQKDEMQSLAELITPSVGLFTNIGEAHSAGFDSRDEKIREKAKLFMTCKQVVCCRDHDEVHAVLNAMYPKKLVTWSMEQTEDCDFYIEIDNDRISLKHKDEDHVFRLPRAFSIWVENAIHVIILSLLSGCSQDEIQEGLNDAKAIPMRLEVKEGLNATYIIDDSYNNDLQALETALNFLKQQGQRPKTTVVLSDIYQSGIPSSELYDHVARTLTQHGIDRLVGVGEEISEHLTGFEREVQLFSTTEELLDNMPQFSNEMILVKGARDFGLERVVRALQQKTHRTTLKINFEAIVHNLNLYRKQIDQKTQIMAMVKAFAYGGGSQEISNLLQFHKVDYLGVAYIDEGVTLRKNGISIPIMVMNADLESFSLLTDHNLEPEVFNLSGLEAAAKSGESIGIHIKIDTGMYRLGFGREKVDVLLKGLESCPQVTVKGVFTHLSSAEDPTEDDFTRKQVQDFDEVYQKISDKLGYRPLRHVVNSAGILRWPAYHYEMVRLGIGLYGFDQTEKLRLSPVSQLSTRISQVKKAKKGSTIGYGRAGKVASDKCIATLPIGYADGYLRSFGNGKGHVMVHGTVAPTIGNICMDMCMVDVTGIECQEGDEVIVFGDEPDIRQLASWADTIPYEILTNVSQRVKRVYVSE